jgi:hypothetical protein
MWEILVRIVKGGDHYKDLDVVESIILKWILKNFDNGVDWLHVAQNRK